MFTTKNLKWKENQFSIGCSDGGILINQTVKNDCTEF